ncbi:helix-turn-helix transcriptional regulator [Fodinicola feengrottensis]|uniref:helix-turn-helix transcriptional regulator n=1 Tax=Fodinicola feengrottensis TaxID=435914 RepID=UPI0031D6C7EE
MACLAEAAHAAALLGDADRAAALLAHCEERAVPGWRGAAFWLDLARPWVAVAGGDTARAVELSVRTVEETSALGAVGFQIDALYDLVRLGEPRMAADELDRLAASAEGPCPRLYADHARASVDGDAAALIAVSERLTALGLALYAAEAAAQAAQLHRQSAGSHDYQAIAARLAACCQGARTPALLLATAPTLTRRELDVARLAATGLTNQQIADRLALSRRTVENHLQAGYAKLGGTRADLPARLAPPACS